MAALERILKQIRQQQQSDREMIELEPEIDERDLPNVAESREEANLQRGGLMKGVVQQGEGHATPNPGDLVFLHYSLVDPKEIVLESTRTECGGAGHPRPFLLGKGGARPLRGVELGVESMRLKERANFLLKPEFGFLHKDCTQTPPAGLRRDDPLAVDVQLMGWLPAEHVHSTTGQGGVVLHTIFEGQGWETPRPPFEVTLKVAARGLSANGQQGQGALYFPATDIQCDLGDGRLPPGLDEAVQAMHRGEQAVVWCPAELASGGAAVPPPPEAHGMDCFPSLRYVEFTVTLVDFLQVRDLSQDGLATKRTLRKGLGEFPAGCPLEDTRVEARVRVRAAGSKDDSVWAPLPGSSDDRGSIEFETGMGLVPEPVEAALRLMLRDEVALVWSARSYAYEAREDAPPASVLPDPSVDVEFKIELVDFDPEPNQTTLTVEDKLARAVKWREQGNALFKAGKYRLARSKYLRGIKSADQAIEVETQEQIVARSAAKTACYVNLAACAQQEGEWGEAIQFCDKAIGEDEHHAKAFFRRAKANAHLGDYAAAKEDFATAKELDPEAASEVDREVVRMAQRARAAADKQRREFGSFFNKPASSGTHK